MTMSEPPPDTPPETPPASFLPDLPSQNSPYLLGEAKALGWNWGGFLMPYLWLVGHGRVTLGLLLSLSWAIPLVGWLNLLACPILGIYLGLNGYEQAWRHQPYHDLEQLRTREREWSIWGFVGVILFLVGIAFFMAFLAPVYREVLDNMEGFGW